MARLLEGSGWAGEMGQHEPYEIRKEQMLTPRHGKEESLAVVQAGTAWVHNSTAESNPGLEADSNLSLGQQYALAEKEANSILCCINKNAASRSREVINSL